MHIGSAGPATDLYALVEHLLDLRVSEAGCETAFSVITYVQDGRGRRAHAKLQQLTHIYWGYQTMQSDHKRGRILKLKGMNQTAAEDLAGDVDGDFDENYEQDGPGLCARLPGFCECCPNVANGCLNVVNG